MKRPSNNMLMWIAGVSFVVALTARPAYNYVKGFVQRFTK